VEPGRGIKVLRIKVKGAAAHAGLHPEKGMNKCSHLMG
jgi:hypothetical protein